MPMANVVISRNSNEVTFIKAFINALKTNTAIIDSGHTVTCDKTDEELDALYATGSAAPQFTVTIDGVCSFTMKRNRNVSDSISTYSPSATLNGQAVDFTANNTVSHAAAALSASAIAVRTFKFQIFANENIVLITVGSYNSTFPLNSASNMFSVCVYIEKTSNEITFSVASTGIGDTFYFSDGSTGTIFNRLQYVNNENDPTDVEIVENKALLSSGNKKKTLLNIYDSSYNPAVKYPVDVEGKQHAYLTNYTLMPIERRI